MRNFHFLILVVMFFLPHTSGAVEPMAFARKAYESMVAIDTTAKNYSDKALDNFKAIFSFHGFFRETVYDIKNKMKEDELKRFHDSFEKVFFKNFANHAVEISKKKMRNPKYEIKNHGDAMTVAVISGDTIKGPLKVSFYLQHDLDQEWKVFDLAIDDVLLSRNYRGSFNRIYREQGFEALLARMTKKYQELENK